MASNQTEYLGLNQWTGKDDFLRAEFNEDNRRVDEAINALYIRSDPVCGTYIGTYGGNMDSSQLSQTIKLGFRPRLVFVMPYHAQSSSYFYFPAALAFDGADAKYLQITDSGFTVSYYTNMKNGNNLVEYSPYRYIAFR